MSTKQGDWREIRRQRAFDLKRAGWAQVVIAEALGVTQGAVSQWLKRAREGGEEALRSRPPPGPRLKLSKAERARLPQLLTRGAEAYGFRGDVWTCPRVTEVIKREFGVTYHPDHVSRILKECGWTSQKPVRRARQRDEEAIERWRREKWPALKRAL